MEAIGIAVVLLGQLIALVVRLYPDGRLNGLIPKIVWLANFLGIAAGFAQKLVEAIGPVALAHPAGHFALAWGGLLAFVKTGLCVAGAAALGAAQRWVWEQFTKHAVPQALLDAGKR